MWRCLRVIITPLCCLKRFSLQSSFGGADLIVYLWTFTKSRPFSKISLNVWRNCSIYLPIKTPLWIFYNKGRDDVDHRLTISSLLQSDVFFFFLVSLINSLFLWLFQLNIIVINWTNNTEIVYIEWSEWPIGKRKK